MTKSSLVSSYRRIADVIRKTQQIAIEVENAPDRRKRLRTFSTQEVTSLLGVPPRTWVPHLAPGAKEGGLPKNRLSFSELVHLREALHRQTGDLRFFPRRRPAQAEQMITIVFSNFKGGSAKTTSSVHFCQYLARAGYRVLLVDLDSQASATAQFGIDPSAEVGAEMSFTAWTAAREEGREINAATICQRTYWPTIDLVPAGAVLAQAEDSLAKRSASRIAEPVLYFEELTRFLGALGDTYDVAVVDTRPDVNMLMTIALHAATGLVVPMRATMTDLASTGEFFAHLASYVSDFEQAFGTRLPTCFTKILIAAFDPTDRSQDALSGIMRDRFGDSILPGEFLHSKIMGTAGFGKETLYEYEPSTDRHAYNRVLASANGIYRAIEDEFLALWGRADSPRRELLGEATR